MRISWNMEKVQLPLSFTRIGKNKVKRYKVKVKSGAYNFSILIFNFQLQRQYVESSVPKVNAP